MGSRLVDYLIEDVRISTENQEFSDTIGIQDSEFLRFLNNAQFRLQSLIVQQHPSVFLTEYEISCEKDKEVYDLPIASFMGNKVTQVEYSATADTNNYYPLRPTSLYNRNKDSEGDPDYYIRKAGKIILLPVPNSTTGLLRITYVRRVPKLDSRRGVIESVVLDTATNKITSLFLNVASEVVDSDELAKWTRICVVDDEGNTQMQNIKFTAIDTSTGEVTVDPSFTYANGETIEAGAYVVAGSNSSTHCDLDDLVERYLIEYATAKILQRDSSIDLTSQMAILSEIENEIINSYAEISDDIMEIPVINDDNYDWY